MAAKFKGPIFGPYFFKVDKPKGITSFDVIRQFKRSLPKNIGKIGHFGTLDPFATGLLVIGIGPATRLNQYTQLSSKEYIATGVLGVKSPTGDFDVEEHEFERVDFSKELTNDEVQAVLDTFVGKYMQSPPAFSATKHEGRPLHEWAREGIIIEKPPVEREIYSIELLEVNGAEVIFKVSVSSGTYIRVLFEDIAEKLGTLGALKELRRTVSSGIDLDNCIELESMKNEGFDFRDFLASKAMAINELIDFPIIDASDEQAMRYTNGQDFQYESDDGYYWVRQADRTLGLAVVKSNLVKTCVTFSPIALDKIDLTICNSLD